MKYGFDYIDGREVPQTVIEEVQKNGEKFSRKGMYVVMVKFITPILLFILFLKSIGLLTFI